MRVRMEVHIAFAGFDRNKTAPTFPCQISEEEGERGLNCSFSDEDKDHTPDWTAWHLRHSRKRGHNQGLILTPSALSAGPVDTRDNTSRCLQTESRHGHGSPAPPHTHRGRSHTRTYTHTQTHIDTHSDTRGMRGRRTPGCRLQAGISFGRVRGTQAAPLLSRGRERGEGCRDPAAPICVGRGVPKNASPGGESPAPPGLRGGRTWGWLRAGCQTISPLACPLPSPLQGTRCTPDPRSQHPRLCTHPPV